ncbi:MAG: hypothetical protein GY842_09905, partial [bacterium]|nr:hypothetical protein [bacterium]
MNTTQDMTSSGGMRVETARAGAQWVFADEGESVVSSASAPDWFGLEDEPRATLVKHNPLRRVYRVKLATGVVYAKVFDDRSTAGMFRRWLFGSPAGGEYETAQALAGLGIGAIRALASGTAADGRSVLVSAEFARAVTLAELWERARPPDRCFAEKLGVFLARTHDAGVLPRDLHAGNLLVRPGAGEWEFALVDLAGVRVRRPVTDGDAARNLAELNQWFRARASLIQRMRLLRAYARERFADRRRAYREFVARVGRATAVHRRRLWAKRDRRIFRDNAYFSRISLGDGGTAHAVLRCRSDQPPPPPFAGERSPDEWRRWLTEHLSTMAGESRGTLLGGFACTRHVGRSWWRRLCGSPLRRSFAIAQRLRHRGLPALHVPVLLERRSVGDSEWVLAVHQPPGAVRLDEIASTLLSAPAEQPVPPAARRRRLSELLTATGHLAAAMVDGGVI